MRHFIATAVFYILNIVLFPVTFLGYVIWTGSLLLNRGSGVSATAQGPLSARWFEHNLGTRKDEPAARLMRVLPGIPPWGPQLVAGPLRLAHCLTGYVPKAFRYPFEGDVPPQYEASARITFFDAVVDRYLPTIKQFVILGAGFDTRALRLPRTLAIQSFEVDTPRTQAVKREMIEKAGLDPAQVVFVAADFEREDWLDQLVRSGFALDEPALFLCEGVLMYLEGKAAEETFRRIARTARGSVVAFDYITTEPLTSRAPYWRYARAGARAGGEPLKFGIDSTPPVHERLTEWLQACGLSPGEHRTLGRETEGRPAWGGFATAVVR